MLKNEMQSYVRIEGRGLKNLMYPYMGVGDVKNCKNHPYIIYEWPLTNAQYYCFLIFLNKIYNTYRDRHTRIILKNVFKITLDNATCSNR
jgi:hypothetical protein